MGFIHLAPGVRFDATNEEGRLLHMATGICVDLDPIATLFLQTALSSETKEQALAVLVSRIDATREQLEERFQPVLNHLLTLRFLSATTSSDTWYDTVGQVSFFSAEAMKPARQPQLSRQDRVDWEFFLTGQVVNAPLPHFSFFRRGYAFWKTGHILLSMGYSHLMASVFDLLRRHTYAQQVREREWLGISQTLSRLGSHRSKFGAGLLWRVARRELVFCQILVRCLAPTGVCLIRSIALCTYLRALGMSATVAIGRACFDLSGHYSFHAWVELAGLIVNDHAEVQSGYTRIQRLPFDEETEP